METDEIFEGGDAAVPSKDSATKYPIPTGRYQWMPGWQEGGSSDEDD
jgi:hypothetical protein